MLSDIAYPQLEKFLGGLDMFLVGG
jgi:hypothetical protein